MKRSVVILLFMIITALALSARAGDAGAGAGDEADRLVISDASVQPVPPVSTGTAAYMELTNGGEGAIGLVSVASVCCRAVEMHRSSGSGGFMRMERVHEVVIKEGETVRMAPAGLHIMLIGLKEPVRRGDTVPITLTFRDGSSVTIHARVGTATAGK